MPKPRKHPVKTLTEELIQLAIAQYNDEANPVGAREFSKKHNLDYNHVLKALRKAGVTLRKGPRNRNSVSI